MWVSIGVSHGVLAHMPKGFIDVDIVPWKMFKNGSFSLSHILLFVGYSGYGINLLIN